MIENGCKIAFRDDPSEIFTVSQWDGHKGWAGDENGRGWYFYPSQVIIIDEDYEDEE